MVASAIADWAGVSAVNPATGKVVVAESLFSGRNIGRLLQEMPRTFAEFHPLGMVVVVLFGAGVAEKVGLFDAALRRAFVHVPAALLVPATAVIGILSHIGADAGYFVFIPLAGLAFKAAGRDPFVGVLVAFASVAGGYGANLLITPTDAVVYGVTEAAAKTIAPDVSINLLANYFILAAFAGVVIISVTLVTKFWVEPRHGMAPAHEPTGQQADEDSSGERRALTLAGLAALAPIALAVALALPVDAPLRDQAGSLKPFYDSLVAILFVAFLAAGITYGVATKRIKNDTDAMNLLRESGNEMGSFLLLMFAAAHFAALLTWSNLATIAAANGAQWLREVGLTGIPLVLAFVTSATALDLFMPSASGKWAIIAPAVVPMLMGAGLSPELITAAYRISDSAANTLTPTSLLPIVLIYAQRYRPDLGLGGMIRLMLPYATTIFLGGLALLAFWMMAGLPLGPTGASYAWPAV
jgi:aminobenzoyl-glutamate transport protein